MDDPLAFSPDDESGWQRLARGYRLAGLLLSAHRLGLLRLLVERGRAPLGAMAEDLVADRRLLERMCHALRAGGLLRLDGDDWTLTEAGRRLADRPEVAVELDALAADYDAWGRLDERARRLAMHEPVDPNPYDDYAYIDSHEGAARRYALRLAARHGAQVSEILRRLHPTRPLRVLDVGGGDGMLSREVCRRWPDARSTVLELPAMAEVARAACSGQDRIAVRAGDFFGGGPGRRHDPLPGTVDLVLLSHVLQGMPLEAVRDLVARAARALEPGGCVVSCEFVLGRGERGSLDVSLWAVGQAAASRQVNVLTAVEQDGLLRGVGLAAAGAWWVSASSRAVLGVRTDVGVEPAVRLSEDY